MPVIEILNINQGGIADSDVQGLKNSVAMMVGLNIHEEPGVIKVNQALKKDSGTTVDEEVSAIVPCSDGNTYIFGKTTGKVWKRTSAGVYSLEFTNTEGGILGAFEWDGYILYASDDKLGRWPVADIASRDDDWESFLAGDEDYHPFFAKNGVLYIGDGNYVAQVDDNVFTGDALDLPEDYRVTSLDEVYTDLLVGAIKNSNVGETKIFRWNTVSVSWNTDDTVPQVGINAFLKEDNIAIVQAGVKGDLYYYNGETLQRYKRIPGTYTSSNRSMVKAAATVNFNGMPFFGISNVSGNPSLEGIWSFGSHGPNYPKVLNLEYVISQNVTANVTVTAMASNGDNIFVAWKDSNSTAVYGVDVIDWSNKYSSAYFETRVIAIDRGNEKDFMVEVPYRLMPAGCSLTLKYKTNYASSWTTISMTQDTDRKKFYSDIRIEKANTIKFRLEFVVSGNTAPEIEGMLINF